MKLRHHVFWPPFVLLLIASAVSFFFPKEFLAGVTSANDFILAHFGWAFSMQAFVAFITCAVVLFSPLAEIRIGGSDAKPFLSRWQWFSILLCTTIATGILFWAAAEPLYHFQSPNQLFGADPKSPQAALYGLSTLYLHWTFVPYAIYCVPTIVFALAHYNHKFPFSLRSLLFPIKALHKQVIGDTADIFCLYALVLGMAASLGAGILTINGGLNDLLGLSTSAISLGLICSVIVITFCISASTGLMQGIRILSDINIRIFFAIAIFMFVFGNTLFILDFSTEAVGHFLKEFFRMVLYTGASTEDPWPKSWSIFYWANWMAWAPVTALFLGRLCYGYTIRECLLFNWIFPSIFGCVWISIFSGQTLSIELLQGGMLEVLSEKGPESVIFEVFKTLPFGLLMTVIFLFTTFLSYVTAADSNTEALGQISTKGDMDDPKYSPDWRVKITWGATIGLISWIMVSFSGIDGIKMLSNLGGLVALFLIATVNAGLIKLLLGGRFRVESTGDEAS